MNTIELHAFVDDIRELKIDDAQAAIVDKIFDISFAQLAWEKIYHDIAINNQALGVVLISDSSANASARVMESIEQAYDISRRISHDPETLMGSCAKAAVVKLEKELEQLLTNQPITNYNNNPGNAKRLWESFFGLFATNQFMNQFNPIKHAEGVAQEKSKLTRFSKFHRSWTSKPINRFSQPTLAAIILKHARDFNQTHQVDDDSALKEAVRSSIDSLNLNFFQALDTQDAVNFINQEFEHTGLDSHAYKALVRSIELIFKDCMNVIHQGWSPRVVANGRANWYFGPKIGDIFWEKHVKWIENNGPRLGKPEIELLDETTTEILNLVTDPAKDPFPDEHCKGLVVGYVQSGKTANYSALIAKAIDCGYKNIIVLTGTLENLRKQTQDRICRDLFGIFPGANQNQNDPEIIAAKGHFVRVMPNGHHQGIGTGIIFLTGTEQGDGDLKQNPAVFVNGNINIAVTKKNPATLRWCLLKSHDARAQPTLIIDDEADQASVALRTKAGFEAAAGINRGVRMLLESFTKASYVAYTATPFANMLTCLKPANFPQTADGNIDFTKITGFATASKQFLQTYASNVKEMASLYPKDFIYSLPDPTRAGYMGSERFFGVPDEFINLGTRTVNAWNCFDEDEATGIRRIDPADQNPTGDFPSLRESIAWFLVATAIRKRREEIERANGISKPDLISSMMVHASARTGIQLGMTKICIDITLDICRRVNDPAFEPTLAGIYDENYSNQRDDRLKNLAKWEAARCVDVSFSEMLENLRNLFGGIRNEADLSQVFNFPCDNSTEDSVRILYDRNAPGFRHYIIVNGGNTLTRGLTLEGLVVSHFTRESKQMDTLLQMGRWFGYRIGYHDLCTVYTTESIADKFQRLTVVEDIIRKEIERFRIDGVTPSEVGVRIPLMPDLKICGANRMGDVEITRGERFGKPSQTIIFKKNDNTWLEQNWKAGCTLISSIKGSKPPRQGRNRHSKVFENVSLSHIETFLSQYKTVPNARRFDSESILEYLQTARHTKDMDNLNLDRWNVVLMSLDPDQPDNNRLTNDFGGYDVCMVNRSRIVSVKIDDIGGDDPDRGSPQYEATIGTLISPEDPFIDIPRHLNTPNDDDNFEGSEARFKHYNQYIPLLILYPIWKDSTPHQGGRTTVNRKDLRAIHNVLGASILFPPKPAADNHIDNYAVVRIHDGADLETEEKQELEKEAEAAKLAAQQAAGN